MLNEQNGVEWIYLAQDMNALRVTVNTFTHALLPQNVRLTLRG